MMKYMKYNETYGSIGLCTTAAALSYCINMRRGGEGGASNGSVTESKWAAWELCLNSNNIRCQ